MLGSNSSCSSSFPAFFDQNCTLGHWAMYVVSNLSWLATFHRSNTQKSKVGFGGFGGFGPLDHSYLFPPVSPELPSDFSSPRSENWLTASQRFRGGIHTSGVAGDCTSQAAKRWKKHQRFSQGTAEALEKAFAKITQSLDIVLMCRFPEKKQGRHSARLRQSGNNIQKATKTNI